MKNILNFIQILPEVSLILTFLLLGKQMGITKETKSVPFKFLVVTFILTIISFAALALELYLNKQ